MPLLARVGKELILEEHPLSHKKDSDKRLDDKQTVPIKVEDKNLAGGNLEKDMRISPSIVCAGQGGQSYSTSPVLKVGRL